MNSVRLQKLGLRDLRLRKPKLREPRLRKPLLRELRLPIHPTTIKYTIKSSYAVMPFKVT